MKLLPFIIAFTLFAFINIEARGKELIAADKNLSGTSIISLSIQKHSAHDLSLEYLSVIMIDQNESRTVRKIRHYHSPDNKSELSHLLLIDTPPELKGVSIYQTRNNHRTQIYLPAINQTYHASNNRLKAKTLLGMDFNLDDILYPLKKTSGYKINHEEKIQSDTFYIIDEYDIEQLTPDKPSRRHYLRKDNLYLIQTDYFDPYSRCLRRLTKHDLYQDKNKQWHARMILMENLVTKHKTLIKIDQRILSEDEVPPHIFTHHYVKSLAPISYSQKAPNTSER